MVSILFIFSLEILILIVWGMFFGLVLIESLCSGCWMIFLFLIFFVFFVSWIGILVFSFLFIFMIWKLVCVNLFLSGFVWSLVIIIDCWFLLILIVIIVFFFLFCNVLSNLILFKEIGVFVVFLLYIIFGMCFEWWIFWSVECLKFVFLFVFKVVIFSIILIIVLLFY